MTGHFPSSPETGADFYNLSGPDLLAYCGADAGKWAQAFCRIKEVQGWSASDIDEGLMISWFANAIEHSAQVRGAAYSSWQPIETAPKDGTDFLALCEYERKHHQMVGCFAPNGKFASWPGRNNYHPTHWMPLPAILSMRTPKVRTSHHRNKEKAARLQALVNERLAAPSVTSTDRGGK